MNTTPNSKMNLEVSPATTKSTPKVPNAPKKQGMKTNFRLDSIPKLILPEEDASSEEEIDLLQVRDKYQRYSKSTVMQINDIDELHNVRRWYFPNSQPRNDSEWKYIYEVQMAAEERLRQLNCFCDQCDHLWDDIDTEKLLDYLL